MLKTVHPELSAVSAGATRCGSNLDEIYTNVHQRLEEKCIQKPLAKNDGTESDHSVISASFKLPKTTTSFCQKFSFRPITTIGVESFKQMILAQDWEEIRKPSSSQSAQALDDILQRFVVACFPLKERSIRNTDAPWLDRDTKKMLNKKRRVYKKEGKSENYFNISKICETAVSNAKKKFLEKIYLQCKKAKNTKSFYKTVGSFKARTSAGPWNICSMFPGEKEENIAETVATYFNSISQEYTSLPNPK